MTDVAKKTDTVTLTVDGVQVTAAKGELVTKDEILSRVWSGRVVEENTLQVQVSALRKALGEDGDFLMTLSGSGYRFVADITTDAG